MELVSTEGMIDSVVSVRDVTTELIVQYVRAMESAAGLVPLVSQDEAATEISVALPETLSPEQEHDAQVVFRTVLQGLRDVAQEYPKHLKINDGKETPC